VLKTGQNEIEAIEKPSEVVLKTGQNEIEAQQNQSKIKWP